MGEEPLGLQTQLFLSGSSQKQPNRTPPRTRNPGWCLVGSFELSQAEKIKTDDVETIILDEFDNY